MIDCELIAYNKLKEAHELCVEYRLQTHSFIMLETHYMGTDIGSDGIIEDYFSVEYILYFNHETRIISRNIDEIIDEIKRRIITTFPGRVE